jgi:hypothetical protein
MWASDRYDQRQLLNPCPPSYLYVSSIRIASQVAMLKDVVSSPPD